MTSPSAPPAEPGSTAPKEDNGSRETARQITGLGIDWRSAVLTPLLAFISAMALGALLIAVADVERFPLWFSDPGEAFSDWITTIRAAYGALYEGSLGGIRPISETLTRAAPLILAGLAVAAGFNAGLFNIGAKGQMLIGGMASVWVGYTFNVPAIVHIPLMILGGIAGGAFFGAIPGWLRGKTGAHEVITTIMLNFVALGLIDWLLNLEAVQAEGRNDPISKSINDSAKYPPLLASLLDNGRLRVHLGIIIALLAAVFLWWLLNRTTIGFELRTVGRNPDAARYAGINVTRAYITVMALSGAFAGLAGTDLVAGQSGRATSNFAGDIGFDAIAIALLGRSHPAGVVASGILFGGLAAGGQKMQVSSGLGIDLVTVVQALIVVFIAAPALIRAVFRVRPGESTGPVTAGWST